MLDTTNLEYGIQYDLRMKCGHVNKGWYLYNAECGYFTKTQGKQTDGFVYSESVESVIESKQ